MTVESTLQPRADGDTEQLMKQWVADTSEWALRRRSIVGVHHAFVTTWPPEKRGQLTVWWDERKVL